MIRWRRGEDEGYNGYYGESSEEEEVIGEERWKRVMGSTPMT